MTERKQRDVGPECVLWTDPPQPGWFRDNRDFAIVRQGLREVGFAEEDADRILGLNWYRFFDTSFMPRTGARAEPSRYKAGAAAMPGMPDARQTSS